MIPTRLAIVHHDRSFFPFDLRQALGPDIEPIWVTNDQDGGADPTADRLLRRLGTLVDVTGLGARQAAQALRAQHPDGIVTFVDDHLELTAAIAAELGLPYHSPEVAATLADKSRQRVALAAAGVPGPRFWTIPGGADAAGVRALAEEITYPAVLKPAAGSGSRGIVAVSGPEELLARYEPGTEAVIEAYLDDDPAADRRFASYLSVETAVSPAGISHVALCGRFALAPPFRETGNFIPAALAPDGTRAVLELTDAAITALGVTSAVLHTEIKLTPRGPRIIEVNGRLGGRPPFVLQRVSDVNLFRAAAEVALGEPVRFDGLAVCREVGYWRMLQPPMSASVVRDVRGISELSAAPGVDSVRLNRGPGTAVDWREGTDGPVVTVQGRVRDLNALADVVARIDATIEIDYAESDAAG